MAVRLLFSVALGVVAVPLGALLLNWLYPVVGQGLAGGAIVLFRGVAAGVVAAVIAFALYPRLSPKISRRMLWMLGVPAVGLLALLAMSVRQSGLEQDAYLEELRANLPPFRMYLASREKVGSARFIDIEFDSAQQQYAVRYPGGRSCTGNLPAKAAQKMQLLQALRGIEILLYKQPNPCQEQANSWLYSLSFEIHDAGPPHRQYAMQFGRACMASYPATRQVVDAVEQAHDDLQRNEQCE